MRCWGRRDLGDIRGLTILKGDWMRDGRHNQRETKRMEISSSGSSKAVNMIGL